MSTNMSRLSSDGGVTSRRPTSFPCRQDFSIACDYNVKTDKLKGFETGFKQDRLHIKCAKSWLKETNDMSFRVSVGDAICEWKKTQEEGLEMAHDEVCERLGIDTKFFNEYLKISVEKFEKQNGFYRSSPPAKAAPKPPPAKANTKGSVKSALKKGATKATETMPAPVGLPGMAPLSKAAQRAQAGGLGGMAVAADLGAVPVVPLAKQATSPINTSAQTVTIVESDSEEESQEKPVRQMVTEREAQIQKTKPTSVIGAAKAQSQGQDSSQQVGGTQAEIDAPLAGKKRGQPVDMKVFRMPVMDFVQTFGDENARPALPKRRRIDAISDLKVGKAEDASEANTTTGSGTQMGL